MFKTLLQWIAIAFSIAIFGSKVFAQHNRAIDSASYRTKRDMVDILVGWKITDTATSRGVYRQNKKVRLSLLPSAASIPGTSGIAFVTAISASFFLGDPQTTNLSNIYFTPYTNFEGKFVFPMRTYIWTKDNKWNFIGDYRYLIYPEYTYGLGSNSELSDQTLVNYKQFRFHQSVLRNVFSYVMAGGGVNFDYHYDIDEPEGKYVAKYEKPPAASSVSNSLIIEAAFDSRQNSINPQGGVYTDFVYRYTPLWLGSTYNWHSVFLDFRTYHSFNRKKQKLLAFRSFYWDVFKGQAPYLDLPATFWDPYYRAGRGYYQARFRGDAMGYLEAEYRFDISKNGLWGAAVFANAQTLRDPATNNFGRVVPAVGSGLRLKFNKYSNCNITFDVAVGYESWNWFLNLGEYF